VILLLAPISTNQRTTMISLVFRRFRGAYGRLRYMADTGETAVQWQLTTQSRHQVSDPRSRPARALLESNAIT